MKSDIFYHRYIEYGSEYEVILSDNTRYRITDVMSHLDWIDDDQIDINEIMNLWDAVTNDLWILLLDCFSRFQPKS